MYFDDDFYYEPSEFEQQITEFKAALAESVKEKFKAKLDALEKENAELREFKEQKAVFEKIMRDKVAECNRATEQAEWNAKFLSLKKIFGENLTSAYRPSGVARYFKKCDRCDSDRMVNYKTPLGRNGREECVCRRSVTHYDPREVKLTSFYASTERSHRPTLYYELADSGTYSDRYDLCGEIYSGAEFENVNRYKVVFFDEVKCREYCDWLNERETEKEREHMEKWGLEIEE